MKGYPLIFIPLLLVTLSILTLTGFALAPNTLVMRLDYEIDWYLSGSLRHFVTTSHGAAAVVMTFLLGSLWTLHVRNGIKKRKHLRSGLPLFTLLIFLVLSGLGLYYFGSETLQTNAAISHLIAGAALPILYITHRHTSKK